MSLSIVVPKMIPPGQKVDIGRRYQFPTCDRCLRESSERNPVILSKGRPSHDFREALRGFERRDAICFECRLLLKGER